MIGYKMIPEPDGKKGRKIVDPRADNKRRAWLRSGRTPWYARMLDLSPPIEALVLRKHNPAKRAAKAVEHKQLQAKDRR